MATETTTCDRGHAQVVTLFVLEYKSSLVKLCFEGFGLGCKSSLVKHCFEGFVLDLRVQILTCETPISNLV